MLKLGDQDEVITEELPDGCAEGMVDGAELFAGLHLNEGLDSAVVCRHLQHGSAQVP